MKHLVLPASVIIFILFILYNNFYKKSVVVTISYDEELRKAKLNLVKMTEPNLSVYENLNYSNSNISAKVLSQEKPIDIKPGANIVEDIINDFINKKQVGYYNGIKISLSNKIERDIDYKLLSTCRGYMVDLGYYLTEERALKTFEDMRKIDPTLIDYDKVIQLKNFKEHYLYNILVVGIVNFNSANSICTKLANFPNCLVRYCGS